MCTWFPLPLSFGEFEIFNEDEADVKRRLYLNYGLDSNKRTKCLWHYLPPVPISILCHFPSPGQQPRDDQDIATRRYNTNLSTCDYTWWSGWMQTISRTSDGTHASGFFSLLEDTSSLPPKPLNPQHTATSTIISIWSAECFEVTRKYKPRMMVNGNQSIWCLTCCCISSSECSLCWINLYFGCISVCSCRGGAVLGSSIQ